MDWEYEFPVAERATVTLGFNPKIWVIGFAAPCGDKSWTFGFLFLYLIIDWKPRRA